VSGAGAVWALAARGLWAHRARLTLSALAVVLGVAFIAGTLTLTDSLTAGIARLAPQRATATVRAAATLAEEARPALPDDLPGRLRRLEGLEAATGKVLGGVQLKPATGSVKGPSLGLSWPEDAALSPLELAAGRPPRPGEAVVSAGFARSEQLRVGDAVQVATAQGSSELRVSGTVRVNGHDGPGPAALVVFDLATARRLLGVEGFSSVDVLAAPGTLAPERLPGLEGGRLEVVDPGRAVQDDSAGVGAFLGTVAGILRGFGVLALVVGSFLIFNTLSMLAALRTREFGLLRVVGATPRQLGLLVLLEAAAVGGGASLLGVTVGATAAAGLLAWLASRQVLIAGLAVQPSTVGFAAAAGAIVAVAAALPAALRAARTPLRTLHEPTTASSRPLGRTSAASAAAAAAGAMLVLGGLPAAHGTAVLAGAGLVLAGAIVGLPLLVQGLAWPLRAAGRRLGISALLGLENTTRNRRRTAATAAALMIGLATVVGAATYTTTWRAATTAALSGSVRAGLVVYHATAVGQEPTFDPRVAADLRKVNGVRQVVEVRTGRARVQGAPARIDAADPAALGQALRLRLHAGALDDLREGTVLVSAGQARRHRLQVGREVTVELPRGGPVGYRIAGVYDDTPLLAGYLLHPDSYAAGSARQRDRAAYLLVDPALLAPPGPRERGLKGAGVDSVLSRYQNLGARTAADYTANLREETEFRGALLQGLLWFVTLIALLGIANTQALSVVERTREIGLLRAVGMSARQIARMICAETLVVGLLGAMLGLVVGLAGAWLAVRALSGFPSARLAVPTAGLLGAMLVAVAASVLAARAPARRASRIDVLRAIATE
jgi:putative ABC transport system permease protein